MNLRGTAICPQLCRAHCCFLFFLVFFFSACSSVPTAALAPRLAAAMNHRQAALAPSLARLRQRRDAGEMRDSPW